MFINMAYPFPERQKLKKQGAALKDIPVLRKQDNAE